MTKTAIPPTAKAVGFLAQRQLERGLTLIEVLTTGLVISIFLLGLTGAWHVMNYQFLISRLQDRATRVIRQANDFILYAPYDALPTDGQQILGGFLFEPFDEQSQSYKHQLPYSFSGAVPLSSTNTLNDTKQILLTLQLRAAGSQRPSTTHD